MDFGYRAEDILWLVEHGLLTLGYQSSSYLTDRVPELGFVDLPFLFANNAQARGAMDGALGEFLARKTEERINYRILGWFENGFRHISNRLRPVHMPADLKGMRIRVLPSEIQARTFELLGAVPLRWDLTEAIATIKAGTIDAQENPFANTVTYGVHKFHRFHTVTNHFYISRPIFLHRTAFDAWPEDLQDAMREAVTARSRSSAGSRSRRIATRAQGDRSVRAARSWSLTADEHALFAKAVSRSGPTRANLRQGDVRDGGRLDGQPRYGPAWANAVAQPNEAFLPALVVRRREDQRPEHLVFRLRRVDRRDAHAGHALVEHVGAVRRESRQPEKASASVW